MLIKLELWKRMAATRTQWGAHLNIWLPGYRTDITWYCEDAWPFKYDHSKYKDFLRDNIVTYVIRIWSKMLENDPQTLPDDIIKVSIQWKWNYLSFNTLRPRQNDRRFADDTFKRIFLNENVRISIKISLKFVPKGPINSNPSSVQIMAWRRSGDKPLSEPMMVSLLTHICVTRPQWVNEAAHVV